jgi:2-polyprenyl-3-methyl-5-hydroxy-6-metoxy-1,4-benzoquinol methylase
MTELGGRLGERVARLVLQVPVLGTVARRVRWAPRDVRSAWHTYSRKRAFTVSAVTRHNTREAYNTLYRSPELLAEYLQESRLRFFAEIADTCLEEDFQSVLDAGCGTGHLLRTLAERAERHIALAGFDYAEAGVEKTREISPQSDVRLGNVYDPPFNELFDLVVCTEVLEHVKDPQCALAALAARCSPGGRIVVTVPDGLQDDWEGHVNFWSAEEFATLLEEIGPAAVRSIENGKAFVGIVHPHPLPLTGAIRPVDDRQTRN